ncbi:MAG: selenocysteine-specific translation elongation factor [Deltaproteobacteria bacterium]|nr:selenocysteine-specific translation elongation factor [Deltaproteobacteria bacterium]
MRKENLENKAGLVIGTAGHIDHGKTSLVMALTGIDTDRLAEEKKRGLTIDLGFASLVLPSGVSVSIIDVPGHERFIRNMLAGVGGIDAVLFCVAADDGIMPQTIEHFDIVTLLGVRKGVFVITKADIADDNRLREVTSAVNELKRATLLGGAPVVAVSTHSKAGMDELKSAIEKLCSDNRHSAVDKRFRLPIDRSFSIKGFGAVVTGTVASGEVVEGAEVAVFPSGKPARVRGIESHGTKLKTVSATLRAALNLSGVSHHDIKRGDMLLGAGTEGVLLSGIRRFDCVLNVLKNSPRPLSGRTAFTLYHFTKEVGARVRLLNTQEALPGQRVYARVFLKEPLMMFRGDRFIVRDPSLNRTIGGGEVVLPYLSARVMPKLPAVPFDAALKGDAAALIDAIIQKNSGCAEAAALSFMLGLETFNSLIATGGYGRIGSLVFKEADYGSMRGLVTTALAFLHKERPADKGFSTDDILKSIPPKASGIGVLRQLFDEGLSSRMITDGVITKNGALFSLPSYKAPAAQGNAYSKAVLGLFENNFSSVKKEDILKLSAPKAGLEDALKGLIGSGEVVKIRHDVFMSGAMLKDAEKKLREFVLKNGSIKAADFRDVLGCGRKAAIEILEYFDKERVTLRAGDARTLR